MIEMDMEIPHVTINTTPLTPSALDFMGMSIGMGMGAMGTFGMGNMEMTEGHHQGHFSGLLSAGLMMGTSSEDHPMV
jgi:hypothetical protein